MLCPTLAELPDPPAGRSGWPWTEETTRIAEHMPDGSDWPRVSIVTPSLNQGEFLEETIRSILLQGYPNIEYFIFDGGSQDGSLEIIAKYQAWISHWASRADRGQAEAINKGWRMASGEILAWLNADDLYTPGAIATAASALAPDGLIVYSSFQRIDESSRVIGRFPAKEFSLLDLLTDTNYIPQPTAFLRRSVIEKIGILNESLSFAMDLEYWLRIGRVYSSEIHLQRTIRYLPDAILASYRIHRKSKSAREISKFRVEWVEIWNHFFSESDIPPEAAAIKPTAYAYLYYQLALSNIRHKNFQSGLVDLKKCIQASPPFLIKHPKRLLRLPFVPFYK